MIKKFLLLLIFLIIPLVSAQNISVDYPTEVVDGEEFSFKITLSNFEEDIYDVKIDIFGNEIRISKILDDDKWKSTFYYVKDIISPEEEKEFSLKIENYAGKADIIIKIRNSAEKVEIFEGYEIEIIEKSQEPPPINDFDEDDDENGETNESTTEITNTTNNDYYYKALNENKREPITAEIIKLNPKVIKSENDSENNKNLSDYAIYTFVVFCILLGFLFALKKYKAKKNETEW